MALEIAGVPCWVCDVRSVERAFNLLSDMGQLLGVPEKGGELEQKAREILAMRVESCATLAKISWRLMLFGGTLGCGRGTMPTFNLSCNGGDGEHGLICPGIPTLDMTHVVEAWRWKWCCCLQSRFHSKKCIEKSAKASLHNWSMVRCSVGMAVECFKVPEHSSQAKGRKTPVVLRFSRLG